MVSTQDQSHSSTGQPRLLANHLAKEYVRGASSPHNSQDGVPFWSKILDKSSSIIAGVRSARLGNEVISVLSYHEVFGVKRTRLSRMIVVIGVSTGVF